MKIKKILTVISVLILVITFTTIFASCTEVNQDVSLVEVTFEGYEHNVIHTTNINTIVKKPLIDPVKEGYRFLGWYYCDVEWDFAVDIVETDLTLVPKWMKFS